MSVDASSPRALGTGTRAGAATAWLTRLRRGHWTVVGVIAFALFMDFLIYGLVIPLLPYSHAGISRGNQFALLSLGYAAGVLVATPGFGYLGDHAGCRLPLVCGVALAAVATLLLGVAPDFWTLLVARLLQGAASAATWTAGLALVAIAYPTQRAQMLGIAMTGSTCGLVVGPLIGGWLNGVGGYVLPFLVACGLLAIDGLMRVSLLPKGVAAGIRRLPLRRLLFGRSIAVPALAVVVAAFAWGVVEPLLPDHLLKVASVGPDSVGLMFTIAAAASGLSASLAGWVSDRAGVKTTMCLATVATATTLALLATLSGPAFVGLTFVGVALALVSFSFQFLITPASAELGNVVERRGTSDYAAVYGVFNVAYSIGMMGAGGFAAALSRHASLPLILMLSSGVVLVCLPLVLLTDTGTPTRRSETTGEAR